MKREPTARDREQATIAVDMLLMIECLPYSIDDLARELKQAGLLKHKVKYAVNRVTDIINRVSHHSYNIFKYSSSNPDLPKEYINVMERMNNRIDEHIYVTDVESAMNKIVTLIRTIQRLNNGLMNCYYYEQAEELYAIPKLLDVISYEQNNVTQFLVDRIIEKREYKVL